MTQSRLLRIVAIASAASLLLPLIIGLSTGEDGSTANKLAQYLQLSAVRSNQRDGQVKTAEDSGVPASNLPGQSVGKSQSGTATQGGTAAASAAANKQAKAAGEYVVKQGDTYGCIAEKYYGSYEQYSRVMAANWADTAPGYGEFRLDVGAKVRLPAVSAAQMTPVTNVCK